MVSSGFAGPRARSRRKRARVRPLARNWDKDDSRKSVVRKDGVSELRSER